MKIADLRQSILKNQQSLQKPKYIVLTNDDYSALKEEVSEVCVFLDVKNGRDEMRFNDIQIIAESDMLDLRNPSTCRHQQWYTTTGIEGRFCFTCGVQV